MIQSCQSHSKVQSLPIIRRFLTGFLEIASIIMLPKTLFSYRKFAANTSSASISKSDTFPKEPEILATREFISQFNQQSSNGKSSRQAPVSFFEKNTFR